MASKVSYKQGSKATYLGLLARNPDALYFCTDTHELFRGDDLYSDGLRIVGSYQALPTYAFAADGIIYFCKDTGCGYVLNEARDGWINVIHGVDNKTIVADENGLLRVDVIPISSVAGLEEKLANINNGTVSSGVITSVSDELTVSDSGMLSIRAVEQVKVIGLEDKLASIEKSISGGNVDFRTDETLILKDGILSVNTTNDMEQDNTLPITSAGVFATVGNIEALLKTI